jgi:hypothetical protein
MLLMVPRTSKKCYGYVFTIPNCHFTQSALVGRVECDFKNRFNSTVLYMSVGTWRVDRCWIIYLNGLRRVMVLGTDGFQGFVHCPHSKKHLELEVSKAGCVSILRWRDGRRLFFLDHLQRAISLFCALYIEACLLKVQTVKRAKASCYTTTGKHMMTSCSPVAKQRPAYCSRTKIFSAGPRDAKQEELCSSCRDIYRRPV